MLWIVFQYPIVDNGILNVLLGASICYRMLNVLLHEYVEMLFIWTLDQETYSLLLKSNFRLGFHQVPSWYLSFTKWSKKETGNCSRIFSDDLDVSLSLKLSNILKVFQAEIYESNEATQKIIELSFCALTNDIHICINPQIMNWIPKYFNDWMHKIFKWLHTIIESDKLSSSGVEWVPGL